MNKCFRRKVANHLDEVVNSQPKIQRSMKTPRTSTLFDPLSKIDVASLPIVLFQISASHTTDVDKSVS